MNQEINDESIFNISENYTQERNILKTDYVKYSPLNVSDPNRINSLVTILGPKSDTYMLLRDSYLVVEFEVLKNDNTEYVDNDQIALTNLGQIALFSEAKLTTHSGKHLERIENLHTVSLIYRLLKSCVNESDLLHCFDENLTNRRRELTNNKTKKGNIFCKN